MSHQCLIMTSICCQNQAVIESETDQHLRQLFDACDSDGSGFIGIEEVKEIGDRIGATESDANEIFFKLDKDGDGKVSFEDFRAGFDDYEKSAIVASTPLMTPQPSKNRFTFGHEETLVVEEPTISVPVVPVVRKSKSSIK